MGQYFKIHNNYVRFNDWSSSVSVHNTLSVDIFYANLRFNAFEFVYLKCFVHQYVELMRMVVFLSFFRSVFF